MDANLFNVDMKNRNLLRCRNILEHNSIETNEIISSQYYKQALKESEDINKINCFQNSLSLNP